ncbi:MAG: phenylalanine--tRNA ligase subunit beta [Betaproteobacteria bacterium]|nr:phenylalanine--tRNA ligase subunit beta [Betaproteobacteria bacterium]NBY14239.1 phenylalanine--tRNA ligase subunit beta [Betaproteobacteria bacterium]
MRVPESWLRTWVPEHLIARHSLDEIASRLTMAGLEVEDIESRAPPFSRVVLARILSAEQHPDADRLRVCSVDVGEAAPLQIVCGAPNARAGIHVACALDGAILPGDFKIKATKMRGVVSQGMLCSAKELGLSEESEGILELDASITQHDALGLNVRELLGLDEKTLVLKLTPNRADCLSLQGVARELCALLGEPLVTHDAPILEPSITERARVSLHRVDDQPALCGRFAARIIRGVNARAQTPRHIQEKLLLAGVRPISALVDLSNFMMLDYGQPTHVFDLGRIEASDDAHLSVRWARSGESIELLNGQTVELDERVGVVADAKGPLAIGGVMGGLRSAVSEETQDIIIESAFWWPDAIRGRAQRYKLSSDAAHRFERGVDPEDCAELLERLTAHILDVCGGQAGPITDVRLATPERRPVAMRRSRCQKVLGRPYSDSDIRRVFKTLGIEFTVGGDDPDQVYTISPPSFRFDIEREEDLIEEVARMVGFDAIPAHAPRGELAVRVRSETERSPRLLRSRLVGADFHEVVTYSFIDAQIAAGFAEDSSLLHLLNPIASHMSTMRPSLIPGLLGVLTSNLARQQDRVRLFEFGRIFVRDASVVDGPLTVAGVAQPHMLSGLVYGSESPEQWGLAARGVDFFDLKFDLEGLLAPLPLTCVRPGRPKAWLHPGRSADLWISGQCVGVLGEIHPRLQQSLELPRPALVFEMSLQAILKQGLPQLSPVSRFPSVSRDLAFVMNADVASGDVLAKVRRSASSIKRGQLLREVSVFDDYRGAGMASDEKSLAFRFVLQDTEKTLEDAEVDSLIQAFSKVIIEEFNARQRA